jgi:hypothetical protein
MAEIALKAVRRDWTVASLVGVLHGGERQRKPSSPGRRSGCRAGAIRRHTRLSPATPAIRTTSYARYRLVASPNGSDEPQQSKAEKRRRGFQPRSLHQPSTLREASTYRPGGCAYPRTTRLEAASTSSPTHQNLCAKPLARNSNRAEGRADRRLHGD